MYIAEAKTDYSQETANKKKEVGTCWVCLEQ